MPNAVIRKLLFTLLLAIGLFFQDSYAQTYHLFVAAESDDEVAQISFDAASGEGKVEQTITVGQFPVETEGPHGVAVSPDGNHLLVSIAHGQPYGFLQKFDIETGRFIEQVELGMFPATMDVSPESGFAYIVNFNLHGDMEPSTVSVVDIESMEEIAQIPTGIMPHGSRISPNGRKQYHVTMMDDRLHEVDGLSLKVLRTLDLVNNERADPQPGESHSHMHQAAEGKTGNGDDMGILSPTWVDPHPSKPFVYVALNGNDEVVEVDTEEWKITRRFETRSKPYNLEVSEDGTFLVISHKGQGRTSIWNLGEGRELKVLQNSRDVGHGVAISPDSRYAFVTMEGVGSEPGSVEVVDLETLEVVEVIETGKQAAGIEFWKTVE